MIALVPGEEELGPQKQCNRCGEWWPVTDGEGKRDTKFFAVLHIPAGRVVRARGRTYTRRSDSYPFNSICRSCSDEIIRTKYRSGKRPAA